MRNGLMGRGPVLAGIAVGALALAGCGGSDEKSDEPAATTGAAVAGAIGVEQRNIGLIQFSSLSPMLKKTEDAIRDAAEALGWKITYVDTALDPQKTAAAPGQLAAQKVDGIIAISVPGQLAQAGLKRAQQAGILTCQAPADVGASPVYDVQYHEDETKMGEMLGQQMIDSSDGARIANLQGTISPAGVLREKGMKAVVEADPDAKVVASAEPDLTQPTNIQKAVTDILKAHPDTNSVFALFDNMAEPSITAVRNARSDAKVFTYYATPSNIELLRKGALEAVLDVNVAKTGVVCLDQMVQQLAGDKEMDPEALDASGGLEYRILDGDNLDELVVGDETFPNDEMLKPFLDKWAAAFPAK